MALPLAATGSAQLAAPGLLVDCRPGAPLGLLLGDAALLIALLDVFGLALLFFCVARFITLSPRGMTVSFD
jgi:hypothetical protein